MSDRIPRPPIAHYPEAILTIGQVAEWLQVSERTVERMNVPHFYAGQGNKFRRYLAKQVIAFLEKKSA